MMTASKSRAAPALPLRATACTSFIVSSPGNRCSIHAVKAERAAGHDLLPRLRRQWPEPLAHHLRRAREEAVLVRIIGRPHDLVRTDIVGHSGDAVLHRLARDPAVAPEQLGGP